MRNRSPANLRFATPLPRTDAARATRRTPFAAPPLVITSNRVGDGSEAEPGREVTVHCTGWMYDPDGADNKGRRVDCSRTDGRPITFRLGGGTVTRAWEEGVAGMKVGGRRTVIVGTAAVNPAHGSQRIADTALVYYIELLDVR
jgi:FKBP-type peptidyl-prolyl cis-trans isomerase FkpA